MLDKLKKAIVAMVVVCAGGVSQAGEFVVTDKQLAQINAVLDDAQAKGYSGYMHIIADGGTLLSRETGAQDIALDIPNTANTVFDFGSNTKQFTAVAIMKLHEQGKLSLEQPLSAFFDQVSDEKSAVTIHQLLTHTAGFEESAGRGLNALSKQDFLNAVLTSPLEYPVGQGFNYSNIGYSLLAAIIEQVAGLEYEAYLQQHLFGALNMQSTGYLLPQWPAGDIAEGYYKGFQHYGNMVQRYRQDGVTWNLVGNGGLQTTAADFAKWMVALQDGRVLSKASIDKLLKPYSYYEDSQWAYGYGWTNTSHDNGLLLAEHSGSNGLFWSDIVWIPEYRLSLFFASNAQMPATGLIAKLVRNILLDNSYSPEPLPFDSYWETAQFISKSSQADVEKLEAYLAERSVSLANESLLNSVANWAAQTGKLEWPTMLLQYAIRHFPTSGNLHDSFGEALLLKDDLAGAKQHFQQALQLAPSSGCKWCKNSRKQLAGIHALKLIATIGSHDYDVINQFTRDNISASTLERIGLDMYSGYLSAESHFHGGFELSSLDILDVTDGVINAEVFVHSRNTDMPYRIELSFNDAAPYAITRIRIRAHIEHGKQTPAANDAEAANKLASYIERLAGSDVFSGVVLVAKQDKILLEKAVGKASKRFNVANNINTRFNLGSMNKMFTSVAILKLVAAGKLALDDRLVDVLGLPNATDALTQIQIQHLLSHTSGVASISCEMGEFSITKDQPTCLHQLSGVGTAFTPGTQFRYSNDGMFMLGLVIEQITGMTYYQFVRENIFIPAQMDQTESLDLQFPVHNAAIGYSFHGKQNQWRNNLFIHDKKGGPAGGGYSTARDLFKFASALQSHSLLNQTLTEKAFAPKTEFNAGNYGFGFIVWNRNGRAVVGHNGSFPGVSTQLEMHPDAGYTIVVLSNHSFGADPVIAKAHQLFGL